MEDPAPGTNTCASRRMYFCFMGCSSRASSLFTSHKTEARPSMTAWHSYPVRREGDSNPRYGYPYGSLANCWFKPLTHRSRLLRSQVSQGILSANPRTVQASNLSLLLLQQRGKNRKSLKITQTYSTNCRIAVKTKSLFL